MLPEFLSEERCSLKEGVERKAVACFMRLSPEGEVLQYDIERVTIVNKKRLTYEGAQRILEGKEKAAFPGLNMLLKRMGALARVLKQRRLAEGGLDFNLPETRVLLDDKGLPDKLLQPKRIWTQSIIEEFMLMANKVVAQHLESRRSHSLYRIHDVPGLELSEKVRKLIRLRPAGISPLPAHADCRDLLQAVRNSGVEKTVHKMVLQSLPKARYSTNNRGHFGLGFDSYTHFTSPIRRYPDLLVHRLLFAEGTRSLSDKRALVELERAADHCSTAEERSLKAERDAVALCVCYILAGYVGQVFQGTVTGVAPFGIFIELKDMGADGLLHRSRIRPGDYEFEPDTLSYYSRSEKKSIRLGDMLTVRLDRVNLTLRHIDLAQV